MLTWYPSNQRPPDRIDAEAALQETVGFWTDWTERCEYDGKRKSEVLDS